MPKTRKKSSKYLKSRTQKKSFLSRLWIFLGLSVVIIVGGFISAFATPSSVGNPSCANSLSCIQDLSGKYESNASTGNFLGQVVTVPQKLAEKENVHPVLGENTGNNKHIYVDLTNQRLYAFEGNNIIFNFLVSTGKWGRTPTGEFNIWIKLRYTRMSGGNKTIGTYYDLPNVPYTMFFYNKDYPKYVGYGIHGAYWHNNFGHPMSHGCINMKEEEVAQLYAWAHPATVANVTYSSADDPGTPITIYGTAPVE